MSELYHHGTKGQKWGVRRYQNPDGSLTDEGRRRYGVGSDRSHSSGPGKYITKKGKMSKEGIVRYGKNETGISNNTGERIKQGGKIGATIGGIAGGAVAANTLGTLAAVGYVVNPALALTVGTQAVVAYMASGYVRGIAVGAAVGAYETKLGRELMDANKQDYSEIKVSELQRKNQSK